MKGELTITPVDKKKQNPYCEPHTTLTLVCEDSIVGYLVTHNHTMLTLSFSFKYLPRKTKHQSANVFAMFSNFLVYSFYPGPWQLVQVLNVELTYVPLGVLCQSN